MKFLLLLLALPAALLWAQPPRRPTAQDVEEIRAQIRQKQAERAEREERQSIIPWRQLAVSPDQRVGDRQVLVRLGNATNLYRAVWSFTPEAGTAAAPVRVPLCWRGEQWIALAPGRWQAAVAIGREGGSCALRVPLAPLRAQRGEIYELVLDGKVEQAVMAREREAARAAEETRTKMREPKQAEEEND